MIKGIIKSVKIGNYYIYLFFLTLFFVLVISNHSYTQPKKIGLLIAVDTFSDSTKNLNSVANARLVQNFLIRNYRNDIEIIDLFENNATKTNILSVLDNLLQVDVDTLIIYINTHASNNKLLIDLDRTLFLYKSTLQLTNLDNNINLSELLFGIRKIQNKSNPTIILIIDACRNFNSYLNENEELNRSYQRIPDGRFGNKFMMLNSCESGNPSFQSSRYQHVDVTNGLSVFTFYLLNGLYGDADILSDGIITFYELYGYIKSKFVKHPDLFLQRYPQTPDIRFCDYEYSADIFRNYDRYEFQRPLSSNPVISILKDNVELEKFSINDPDHVKQTGNSIRIDFISLIDTSALNAKDKEIIIKLFNCLDEKKYFLPLNDCAEYYLLKIKDKTSNKDLFEKAKVLVRTTLENSGQEVLNRYLLGTKDQPNSKEMLFASKCFMGASNILKNDTVYNAKILNQIDSKIAFLEGYSIIRTKNESNYDIAESYFINALKKTPDASYLLNGLSDLYTLMGKYKESENFSRKAILSEPYWNLARNTLGKSYLNQNRYEEALQQFDSLLLITDSSSWQAWNNKGRISYELSRFFEAEIFFKKADSIYSDLEIVKYNMLRNFEKINKYKEVKEISIDQITKNKNFPKNYISLASLWRKNENAYEKSDSLLEKALELSNVLNSNKKEKNEILRELAKSYRANYQNTRIEKYKLKSEELLKQALDYNPGDLATNFEYYKNKPNAGLKFFQEFKDKNQLNPKFNFYLGKMFLTAKKIYSAKFYLEKSIELDSLYMESYNYAIENFLMIDELGIAEEFVDKKMQISNFKNDPSTYYYKAEILSKRSNSIGEIFGLLEQSIKIDSNYRNAWIKKSLLYLSSSSFDLESSIECFNKSFSISKSSTDEHIFNTFLIKLNIILSDSNFLNPIATNRLREFESEIKKLREDNSLKK